MISQNIAELNTNDVALKGKLFNIYRMVNTTYLNELTNHGPFTMFVPIDSGFQNIFKTHDSVSYLNIFKTHDSVSYFPIDSGFQNIFKTQDSVSYCGIFSTIPLGFGHIEI